MYKSLERDQLKERIRFEDFLSELELAWKPIPRWSHDELRHRCHNRRKTKGGFTKTTLTIPKEGEGRPFYLTICKRCGTAFMKYPEDGTVVQGPVNYDLCQSHHEECEDCEPAGGETD